MIVLRNVFKPLSSSCHLTQRPAISFLVRGRVFKSALPRFVNSSAPFFRSYTTSTKAPPSGDQQRGGYKDLNSQYRDDLDLELSRIKDAVATEGQRLDDRLKKMIARAIDLHSFLSLPQYSFYQFILKSCRSDEVAKALIENEFYQSREDYITTATHLIFYNEIVGQPQSPRVVELLSQRAKQALSSAELDNLTQRLIILFLKSDFYELALKWHSKRQIEFSLASLDNNKIVCGFFSKYHKTRDEPGKSAYWSPVERKHGTDPMSAEKQEAMSLYNYITPKKVFRRISAYTKDPVLELTAVLRTEDKRLAQMTAEYRLLEAISYMEESYFKRGVIPPGFLDFVLQLNQFDRDLLVSKFIPSLPPYINVLVYHHTLPLQLEYKLVQGLETSKANPGHIIESHVIVYGLLNSKHYDLASRLIEKLDQHRIDDSYYDNIIYEHCQLSDHVFSQSNRLLRGNDLFKNLAIKHFIGLGDVEMTNQIFSSMTQINHLTIKSMLTLYSEVYPVPPLENLSKWQSLERYAAASDKVSVEKYNELLIETLYTTSNTSVIQSILSSGSLMIHKITQYTLFLLLKSVETDQERVDLFKQFKTDPVLDSSIIEILRQSNSKIQDKIVSRVLRSSISYPLINREKASTQIDLPKSSISYLRSINIL